MHPTSSKRFRCSAGVFSPARSWTRRCHPERVPVRAARYRDDEGSALPLPPLSLPHSHFRLPHPRLVRVGCLALWVFPLAVQLHPTSSKRFQCSAGVFSPARSWSQRCHPDRGLLVADARCLCVLGIPVHFTGASRSVLREGICLFLRRRGTARRARSRFCSGGRNLPRHSREAGTPCTEPAECAGCVSFGPPWRAAPRGPDLQVRH
jgi:hypothetical protein